MSKVTLDYCRGTAEGAAIYLQTENGGYRVAGPKCWGIVKPVASFKMSVGDLERLIKEAKAAIKYLKQQ